jgi:hypothetical protein
MGISSIQERIQKRKQEEGDYLADVIVDLCFVTSYKIEDLLKMPTTRLDRLIERFKFHFCGEKSTSLSRRIR